MLKSCLTSIWLVVVLVTLVILNQFVFNLPDEPKPAGEFFDAGGGVRMHYVEHAGKEPTVVLVHGLPGTHRDFDRVVAQLRGRHTIAIDRPGFGDSDGGTQSMFGQAESIHKLLANRGVMRATLVGHSYGAPVVFALAHEHPADVARIVSVGGSAGGSGPGALDKFNAQMIDVLHLPVIEQLNELFVSNLLLRGLAKAQVAAAFSPEDVTPGYENRVLTYTLKDSDLQALSGNIKTGDEDHRRIDRLLDEIRRPTVVLQGQNDQLVDPKYAKVIAREMPNAKLVMIQAGHMIPYTQPAQVVKQIRAVEAR